MKEINIAKVLIAKRREKGITQDDLAEYIGVSKASVSKWETGQSYPDITFLPQLAAYFSISIDDLMGYVPQMEKEDIRKLYRRLAADFASKPFDEVLHECREIIKKYFSCFPLLLQMATLLINHHMLSQKPQERMQILREAAELCGRVLSESGDVWLSKDAVSLEAACRLMLGEPQEVLNLLGEEVRLFSSDDTLISQAFQMTGNSQKAKEVTQIIIYQHLLMLVGATPSYLMLWAEDEKRTEEILSRALAVAKAYHLDDLHSNTMAQTYLAAAHVYCLQGKGEKALEMLRRYADLCGRFVYTLHGDAYFDALQKWFEHFDLGTQAPRSERLIRESMLEAVTQNPAFAALAPYPQYQNILEALKANIGGPSNG